MMKKELIEILKNRDFDKLRRVRNLKKTISLLISFLYGDELYMFRSAEAIGYISRILIEHDAEVVKEIIRRMFWYMNEENAGYCIGAPIVIGEIGRSIGEDFKDFINPTVSLLENLELETKYVIYAIGRIGKRILKSEYDITDKLLKLLEDTDPEVRGYTIKAIKELEITEAIPKLTELLNDQTKVTIYDDGYFRNVKISELAFEALRTFRRESNPE